MNQAQQQRVLTQFGEGVYNVLVCTCVGEEGLDVCTDLVFDAHSFFPFHLIIQTFLFSISAQIGEVDLIVNFDVMKSAIRSSEYSAHPFCSMQHWRLTQYCLLRNLSSAKWSYRKKTRRPCYISCGRRPRGAEVRL